MVFHSSGDRSGLTPSTIEYFNLGIRSCVKKARKPLFGGPIRKRGYTGSAVYGAGLRRRRRARGSLCGADAYGELSPGWVAKKATTAKAAPAKKSADKGARSNKKAEVIAMMKRAKGVTLAEIMEHRHFRDTQFLCRLQPKMTVDHLAVAAGQDWNLEAEFADAAAHPVHGGIVLPRVADVEDQPFDWPELNLQRLR
jgi:hypothetical protein